MGIGSTSSRRPPWRWFSSAASPAAARTIRLVVLGDSLTAGLGLPPGKAFPDRLQAALRAKGWDVEVLNAGVSGDTAADGLARYDWAVPADAEALIVELGANDMLRGLKPEATKNALSAILDKAHGRPFADPPRRHAGRAQSGEPSTTAPSTPSIRLWPKPTMSRSIRSSLTALRAIRSSTRPTACIRPPRGSRRSLGESCLRSSRSSMRSRSNAAVCRARPCAPSVPCHS